MKITQLIGAIGFEIIQDIDKTPFLMWKLPFEMTTAIMNSSFASNHMNQIAIEEIELAYPGTTLFWLSCQ